MRGLKDLEWSLDIILLAKESHLGLWKTDLTRVIYNKINIFGLHQIASTELLKLLEFPVMRVLKISFAMLMRCLFEAPKDGGLAVNWTSPVIGGLEFSPSPSWPLVIKSISNIQWFNHSCLCNETSMKTQRTRFKSLRAGEYMEIQGSWHTYRKYWRSMAFPHTLSYVSLPFCCSELNSFIISR